MTKLTYNEKEYNKYLESNMYTLSDAYKKPNKEKEEAWDWCLKVRGLYEGCDLRIIEANSKGFTAGFYFYDVKNEPKFMFIKNNNAKAYLC